MFPIDISLLPSLTTRKALLVVDAQNDFLAEDGALPAKMPMNLSQRIGDLANNFRKNGGEIIWVQSQFESSRPLEGEQIMISDSPSVPTGSAPPRGRRSRATPPATEQPASPEAFLTAGVKKGPNCIRPGSLGAEMHPIVKQAVGPKDHVLTKTFYSAFKSDALLGLLRVRFVTELFICGSLTNVGVMATAIDAASYGYTITIVDDCCGAQSMSRHRAALRQISNTTGCDTLSATVVLDRMKPEPAKPERSDNLPRQDVLGGKSPTVRVQRGKKDAVAPSVSSIQPSLEKLSLSGEPAAAHEHAHQILPSQPLQQQRRGQTQQSDPDPGPESKPQSRSAIQPMAGADNPQNKNGTHRNTMIPTDTRPSVYSGHISSPLEQAATTAYTDDKKSDSGRGESVRLKSDRKADAAEPPAWGSSEEPLNGRSQQTTPLAPPNSTALASPLEMRHEVNAVASENNNKKRNNSKGAEDSPSTTSYLGSPTSSSSSKRSSESPETSSAPAKTTSKDETTKTTTLTAATACPSLNDGDKQADKMTTPEDARLSGESELLCEGDTKVIYNVLPEPLAQGIFERIRDEVSWQRMSHQGGEVPRLVAVQGLVEDDGSKPVYRHPSDESPPLRPFTAGVDEIRRVVEKRLGHPLNHVLIQLYRHGNDYISEHSDKTLDIARDSFIANVSLGAERTMTLRTKRVSPKESGPGSGSLEEKEKEKEKDPAPPPGDRSPSKQRRVQRARLPHNSLFQMGLATNMRWMHAIRQDKRAAREKSPAELAFEGARISLTFRRIATFLDAEEAHIWGQGATVKTRSAGGGARPVVNGQTDAAIAMLRAFGRENQSSEFDWEAHYGAGFDVLHISAAARLFLSSDDAVVNMRLQIMLAELGVSYARGSLSTPEETRSSSSSSSNIGGAPTDKPKSPKPPQPISEASVKFADNDSARTVIEGQRDIMFYLQRTRDEGELSTQIRNRFEEALALLPQWRASCTPPPPFPEKKGDNTQDLTTLLTPWEKYAAEESDNGAYIAGPEPSIADYALWPVLHDIFSSSSSLSSSSSSSLLPSTGLATDETKKDEPESEKVKETQEKVITMTTEKKPAPPFPQLQAYYERMRSRDAVAKILATAK